MFYFSKSRYCLAWQCPKLLWLSKYKPELKPEDPSLQARFDEGNVVGDMAMGLFGDFTEVTAFKEDGKLDLSRMQELTKECIANGIENICEASFNYDGLYCAVDILRKENSGRDRGGWQATVHGVTKNLTQLSDWAHSVGMMLAQ